MRLLERTLVKVEIAPRIRKMGALGSRSQAFSEQRTAVRASVLPEEGRLHMNKSGICAHDCRRVLVPLDAPVTEGDALVIDGKFFTVLYIKRWQSHMALTCEAVS